MKNTNEDKIAVIFAAYNPDVEPASEIVWLVRAANQRLPKNHAPGYVMVTNATSKLELLVPTSPSVPRLPVAILREMRSSAKTQLFAFRYTRPDAEQFLQAYSA